MTATVYQVIRRERRFASLSRKKLDRARRLHARLVWPRVEAAVVPTLTSFRIAQAAKAAGLYAESTYTQDVHFSLCRKWYRMFSPPGMWYETGGCTQWLEDHKLILRPHRWLLERMVQEERAAAQPAPVLAPASDLGWEDW